MCVHERHISLSSFLSFLFPFLSSEMFALSTSLFRFCRGEKGCRKNNTNTNTDIDVAADAAVDHLPALASVLQRKLNEKMHTTWASWVPHTEQATPTAPSTVSTTPADSTEAKSVGLMEEEIEALTVAVDEPAQEAMDVQGQPTAIETHAPQPIFGTDSPQEPPLHTVN